MDENEAAEQWDREHAQRRATGGLTGGTAGGTGAAAAGTAGAGTGSEHDRGVEHYERTADSETERERHFERDESGRVVRDEEQQRER